MTEPVPAAVVEALAGYPNVGVVDVMIPLLTVDSAGYPHVCLLSRAELDADADRIYAVVASPTTKSNLTRDRRATLVVFQSAAAHYCKLDVIALEEDGGHLGVAFAVSSSKVDGDGSVDMEPPRYLPTDAIASGEHWVHSRELLASLRSQSTSDHGT